MSRFALTAERVLIEDGLVQAMAVVIENGRIAQTCALADIPKDAPLQDLGAGILAPGFIDIQVNGGGGVLLNETPTVAGVAAIAAAHRKFGTTGILPTVITDAPDVMRAAVEAVGNAIRQGVPGVIGVHIEGPFIDTARKGAHDERFIRQPSQNDIAWLETIDCGSVLITLAPNRVPPATIRRLVNSGLIVSLGHCDATAAEVLGAVAAGARGVTHLFNAMSQMTGRAPGLVGAALASPALQSWVIADGHHVDPLSLGVAIRARGRDDLFLVSDAMPSAAGGPRAFALQGRSVAVVNGRLQLADGTLAGATITLGDAVRYATHTLELDRATALAMATLRPARFLRRDDVCGVLKSGRCADVVHLSDGLDLLATWSKGKLI